MLSRSYVAYDKIFEHEVPNQISNGTVAFFVTFTVFKNFQNNKCVHSQRELNSVQL